MSAIVSDLVAELDARIAAYPELLLLGQQWDPEVIQAYFTARADILQISGEERANLTLDVQQWT